MEQSGSSICKDCNGDCNGHVILEDQDNDGKVAVLAHGGYGALPTLWKGDNGGPNAACSSDHFGCDYNKDKYGELVVKFNYIVEKGPYDTSLSKYIKLYNPTQSTLITKQAFIDAGLQTIWNDLGIVANDGVALSWGHGFYGNGCGDMVFVKQGQTSRTKDKKNPNNISLNLQIDMRAWSGEMSDTPGGHQGYIVEGLDYAEDSASCLQPLTIPFSSNDANTLFKFLCSKSSSKGACIMDINPIEKCPSSCQSGCLMTDGTCISKDQGGNPATVAMCTGWGGYWCGGAGPTPSGPCDSCGKGCVIPGGQCIKVVGGSPVNKNMCDGWSGQMCS